MVPSIDNDSDYFDTVAGVLKGDTLALDSFIICLDNVLLISVALIKENDFTLNKARSRRFPTETITDANYADNLTLLANTPA